MGYEKGTHHLSLLIGAGEHRTCPTDRASTIQEKPLMVQGNVDMLVKGVDAEKGHLTYTGTKERNRQPAAFGSHRSTKRTIAHST